MLNLIIALGIYLLNLTIVKLLNIISYFQKVTVLIRDRFLAQLDKHNIMLIDLPKLVDLAVGSSNSNLNFQVLNVVLKAIVYSSGFEKVKLKFNGSDTVRMRNVIRGKHDNGRLPLTDFTVIGAPGMGELNMSGDSAGITGIVDTTEDIDLNHVQMNQDIEHFENNVIDTISKTVQLLNSKLEYLENKYEHDKKQSSVADTIDESVISDLQMSKVSKKVRVLANPSKIYKPEDLPLSLSKYDDDTSHPTIGDSSLDEDGKSENCDPENSEYTSMSSLLNKTKPEKYILKNNKPATLAKHIEKMLTRLNKIEYSVFTFMGHRQDDQSVNEDQLKMLNAKEINNTIYSLVDTVKHLTKDNDRHDVLIDTIHSDLENIENNKISKSDLENAIAVLPTTEDLNNKVSVVDFNITMGDLDDAFLELRRMNLDQGTKVMTAITEVITNVNEKAGKVDVDGACKLLESKINHVEKDVKRLLGKDPEAAGTVKYIKDVTCVSCASPVMIQTTNGTNQGKHKDFPLPRLNMQPYIAYDLDGLRKLQNMGHRPKDTYGLHGILRNAATSKKLNETTRRYCGGNDTTTTPKQRVTKEVYINDASYTINGTDPIKAPPSSPQNREVKTEKN